MKNLMIIVLMFMVGALYASNLSPPDLVVYDNVETIFAGDQGEITPDQTALLSIDAEMNWKLNPTYGISEDYCVYIGEFNYFVNYIINRFEENYCYNCLLNTTNSIETILMQKLYRCQINYRSYYANIGYMNNSYNYLI
jgi:hypothetical protein